MVKKPSYINILLALLSLFSLSLFIISSVMILTPGSHELVFFFFLLSTITLVSTFCFYKKQTFSWWFLNCYLPILTVFLLYNYFRLLNWYCLISSVLLTLMLFMMYNENVLNYFKISPFKRKLALALLFGFAFLAFFYLFIRDYT